MQNLWEKNGRWLELRIICLSDGCENLARYIDEDGAMRCGICDAAFDDKASIRMSDVPKLLAAVRALADGFERAYEMSAAPVTKHVHEPAFAIIDLIQKKGVTFR